MPYTAVFKSYIKESGNKNSWTFVAVVSYYYANQWIQEKTF